MINPYGIPNEIKVLFGNMFSIGSIKSMKYHLLRTIKNSKFILEKFSTLLSQEACLNTGPLCPL